MGRRMDDVRALLPLRAVWNVGIGFCAFGFTGKRALVYAVALRTLARNERVAASPIN